MFLPLVFLLLVAQQNGVGAHDQMQISVTTFGPPAERGAPNTFIGTGSQISSSLLASDTPALMWGVVSSSVVNGVCQQIVSTGDMSFPATVSWGGFTDTVNIKVIATGGCLSASDGSGTEALIATSDDRQAAVVCPNDAGSIGCGVYFLGDDINRIYFQRNRRRLLESTTSRKLLNCQEGARKGAISGAIGSVLGTASCLGLGPLTPFCAVGVVGVGSEIGAASGCASGSVSGCFPGDATVLLANGGVKYMAELALGEKVAVRKQDGGTAYEDIYAFGHKDASASGHYIQLSMKPMARGGNISDPTFDSRTLELTPLHFAQVSSGPVGKISFKRAQDIRVGDMMWAQSSNADAITSPYVVTGVFSVVKQGLYNPFTLSGTIIVNGVAASTHSHWFLDNTFDYLGLTHILPSAYQTILSPVRALYYVLGKEAYISLYHHLDTLINVADFGTKYGGKLITLTTTSSIFAAVVVSKLSKSS